MTSSWSRASRRGFALSLTAGLWQLGCRTSHPPAVAPADQDPRPDPSLPVPDPAARPALGALLADNRRKDPEYGSNLSNHQSMALSALYLLGANAARLRAFADHNAARLEPLRAGSVLASDDFQASIGVPTALVGLSALFQQRLASEGRAKVLRSVLPKLMPGLGGALFHGLIRTAYALEADDDDELAQALSYFVTVAAPLRPLAPPDSRGGGGAGELLQRALVDARFRGRYGYGDTSEAMRAASQQAGFDQVVAALEVTPQTLDEISHVSLLLYLGTRDFVSLHTVTGSHALRLLLPYLPQPELALRHHFQTVLAAGLAISERGLREPSRPRLPSWNAIITAAASSNDDHDVKLAYTCLHEGLARDSIAYREAAATRLGLV